MHQSRTPMVGKTFYRGNNFPKVSVIKMLDKSYAVDFHHRNFDIVPSPLTNEVPLNPVHSSDLVGDIIFLANLN